MKKILVSGCLNGQPIRYNRTSVDVESEIWDRWAAEGRLVPFCPELAAGFGIPRPPAEIVGGDASMVLIGTAAVKEDNGNDVSELFVKGAELAVERALAEGCALAVLTDGSPSCGTTYQYDGSFAGGTRPGLGRDGSAAARPGDRGVLPRPDPGGRRVHADALVTADLGHRPAPDHTEAEPVRMPISFGRSRPILVAIGFLQRWCWVEIDRDVVHVQMSWGFRADIPRGSVRDAAPLTGRTPWSIGVHGWRGRWLVNGARWGLVTMEIDPPGRARVAGIPVRLRQLTVGVDDRAALVGALQSPRSSPTR